MEMKYRVTYIPPMSKGKKSQKLALGNVNYLTATLWILDTRTSEFHKLVHLYLKNVVQPLAKELSVMLQQQ